MKHTTILISILAIAACGGKSPPPAEPKEPEPAPAPPPPAAEAKPEPAPAPEPPPPPAPPPIKTLYAQAALVPVKGAKIKGTTVTFTQEGDQPVAVASNGWFDGLKPGKYHLVVHESTDCGPNATRAGKPMAAADVPFAAAKGMDALSLSQVAQIQLQGDGAVVGHALVLHADANGKPGKALACGAIAAAGE
jgi:Cu/Zn superoxide dismutase